jgi:signal transduction histidine kinase
MSLPEANTPEVLLARFDEFIESASRLESSHRELQDELVRLRQQLEERNQALEKSLREVQATRQVLLKVLEAMPCGVVLLDSLGCSPLIANREAQRLLWSNGVTGFALPKPLQEVMRRRLKDPAENSAEEEVFNDATEPGRWLAIRSTRVMFATDAPGANHLLIVQDISNQKDIEREREHARNSVALAEMSSVLAHEIRNPLGAMELFIELLRTQASLSGEAVSWTGHLAAGVRTLAATVNNVLQFYATGSLNLSRVDLVSVLDECTQFLEPVAISSSIHLELVSYLDRVEIVGDEQALRQVILNLCVNAVRHSTGGGYVKISLCPCSTGAVRIEICDQGSGIAPEHLPHIFEAGYSASGRSSGLGLAVCKRIIDAHEGKIGVHSSTPMGTTMYVELPTL